MLKGFLRAGSAVAVLALISTELALAGARIDPALRPFAEGRAENTTITVLALLDGSSEGLVAPRRYDSRAVTGFLRTVSNSNVQRAFAFLKAQGAIPTDVQIKKVHWINSSISCRVTPDGLKILSNTPGVTKIYANRKVSRDPVKHERFSPRSMRERFSAPYDIIDIQLDRLIQENPELDGRGVTIGHVDSGVDGSHPALAGRLKVYYDGKTKSKAEPHDRDGHGTHTAGTMVGTGPDGTRMGMAPGAMLVSAGPLDDYDSMLSQMQFMLDPDGDPSTADMPKAVNNSWHSGGAPDMELFYRAIEAWEAAGIIPVFSAGNAGPDAGSITHPKEHPATFSVGATGEKGDITYFSSRGPAEYKGKLTQKPEITAPGDEILSSTPDGKFEKMSGTSMAAPHVTGVLALLFQIEPRLTPVQARNILIQTASPRKEDGQPGQSGEWNKAYGYGKLDILAAAHMVRRLSTFRMASADLMDLLSSPDKIKLTALLEPQAKTVQDVFAFPVAYEGENWLELSR